MANLPETSIIPEAGALAGNLDISHSTDDEALVNGDTDALNNVNDDIAKKVAQRETRYVMLLRIGLILLLVSAAVLVSATVYLSVSGQEQSDFEDAFNDYSTKVAEAFQSIADRRLGAIAALSNSITSYTLSENATWPFITIPKFEAQVRSMAKLADVEAMAFAPIVSSKDREEWESIFVPSNIYAWQEESIGINDIFAPQGNVTTEVQEKEDSGAPPEYYDGMPDFSMGYSKQIIEAGISPEGTVRLIIADREGPFMPWWQSAPYTRNLQDVLVNFDLNVDPTFNGDLINILSQGKAALGSLTFTGFGNANNPTSGFYYPVLKGYHSNSSLGGSLGMSVYWLPFFSDVLPKSAVGLVGVLQNTCNQTFSFRIDGSNVTYLADTDVHDPKYDYMKHNVSFLELVNESIESKKYLGVPLNENGCQYFLSTYPSKDMENDYTSNKPTLYTVVAILIFLVTSLFFLLYDRLLERRQRLVQQEAEKSGAIVSSLFPAAYRERLMAAQQLNRQKSLSTPHLSNNGNIFQPFIDDGNGDTPTTNYQPIADLFPDCTVLFADIVGFTKWSSNRDPTQVFFLLQEIYGSFDALAKRFGVFKVETIGDCYMAVTGLPQPQQDHARIMARFANDCLIAIHETTVRLLKYLGDDTCNLTLRIGLHSGPVTAGILRGEKSRFQLFGDTVNTASRMESTSEKNKIQISETTAELLRKGGKGHWLVPRIDLVEAKGKGLLQTYWLSCDRNQSASVDNSLPELKCIDEKIINVKDCNDINLEESPLTVRALIDI